MAIITVTVTDTEPVPTAWELPESPEQIRSAIPRGLITFRGTSAIAALDAANQTSYVLSLTMPGGAAYLLKSIMLRFQSDDLTNDFNNLGLGLWVGPSFPVGGVEVPGFAVIAAGELINAAALSNKVWVPGPITTKRTLITDDILAIHLADMSADASTAGDMSYWIEFYVFQVDQIDKWEVNTPIPVISHTSF